MKYGYARVSTIGQADGNSLEGQEKLLKEEGCQEIFADTFTGTKIERPQFSKLLEILKEGDTLVVCKLDRISRSASAGIKLVDDLLNKGVKIHILNMGIMDNTPNGKLIRTIFFSFAEFERDMIVERTREGKAIARTKEGFTEGRPPKYTKEDLGKAFKLKQQGLTYDQVKAATGIGKTTLWNYMKKLNK